MKNIELLIRFCKTIDIICADLLKDAFRLNDERLKLIKIINHKKEKGKNGKIC